VGGEENEGGGVPFFDDFLALFEGLVVFSFFSSKYQITLRSSFEPVLPKSRLV
jgi:hypothetical protein